MGKKTKLFVGKKSKETKKDLKPHYKATFKMDQLFRGEPKKKDETLTMENWMYQAYKGRTELIRFQELPT